MEIREYRPEDLPAMREIWNEVVEAGNAFPQTDPLSLEEAARFFAEQSRSAVAVSGGTVAGLYILHPNNVGRCGHISNASYAVKSSCRGQHVGEALVRDCIYEAGKLGFRILQFNAVVASNTAAVRLYEKLGFQHLGRIPGGFRLKDGSYEDILPFYIQLEVPDGSDLS